MGGRKRDRARSRYALLNGECIFRRTALFLAPARLARSSCGDADLNFALSRLKHGFDSRRERP
jgi:hypothetical protein